MYQEDSDRKLIQDLINGDVVAFEKVYQKYNKKIYFFSLRYLKNKHEAESIVQEVFFKLWKNAGNLKKDSNIDAYLFTVTFNEIRKKFRDSGRERKHLEQYFLFIAEKGQDKNSAYYNDILDKVDNHIRELPDKQKEVLMLRIEEGMTNKEIAAALKIEKKNSGKPS